jgi:hypothetical protein
VKIDGMLVPRTVAFANNRYPKDLLPKLTELGITAYQANGSPDQKHAEEAAGAFRADSQMQKDDLHGKIAAVPDVVVSNQICTGRDCDVALTHFVGNSHVHIHKDSHGVINGTELRKDNLDRVRAEHNELNRNQYRGLDVATTYYTDLFDGGQLGAKDGSQSGPQSIGGGFGADEEE